jgi:hypothetical protein
MTARIVSPACSGRAPSGKAARSTRRHSGSTRSPRTHKPTASRRPAMGISRVENNGQRDHRKDFEYVRWQNARKREEGAGHVSSVVIIKSQSNHPGASLQNIPDRTTHRERIPMRVKSTCTVVNGDAVIPKITRHPTFFAVIPSKSPSLVVSGRVRYNRPPQPRKTQLLPHLHCPAGCLKHFPRWSRFLVVRARRTDQFDLSVTGTANPISGRL